MRRPRFGRTALAALGAVAALALAACSTTPAGQQASGGPTTAAGGLQPVTLQLQWFTQGQFAGYLAAIDQGYYREKGLDVRIKEGGVDIVPQTVLAQGQADYAIAWVPKALASREQGAAITDVAQIFQRSGTRQVAFADKGITQPAQFAGRKIGNWGFGNEFELFAGMTKAGLKPSDVTLVQQQFDMQALLSGEIDAAQAMSYNEYAQVLEARNPATGQLYQPSDFTLVDWNTDGTAMLQDAIWASTDKLSDPAYQDRTVRFVAASIKGWAYCRDNVSACRDIVVKAGSKLGASHQLWQVNEVNKLIWPAPAAGAGTIDPALWAQTVNVARTAVNADGQTVLTRDPDPQAFTNDYVTKAIAMLKGEGVDVVGASYQPETVTLNPGGN
ncbi:ABC transporter substrate-binding protein [Pseudonocardia kujensis]|uniref:ABC transporter substrate-binding protein n=1 Tax=Pseudonocardia kujensis TaxID=1128675 RepID=UPI001E5CC773|nr:ABC transporter substrate-binding protein [Pseudonocardia kujensis]MCE0768021.1 ABC transporter substrate-binding protein [Pseudonocardia kujensis]